MTDEIVKYIHDGKEVQLTGRIARPHKNAPRGTTIMVEIVPIGCDAKDTTYAKWVKNNELLVIQNIEDLDLEQQENNDET